MTLYTQFLLVGFTDSEASCLSDKLKEHLDVDKIANFICFVDGDNTMGAGQLAEKIVDYIIGAM